MGIVGHCAEVETTDLQELLLFWSWEEAVVSATSQNTAPPDDRLHTRLSQERTVTPTQAGLHVSPTLTWMRLWRASWASPLSWQTSVREISRPGSGLPGTRVL